MAERRPMDSVMEQVGQVVGPTASHCVLLRRGGDAFICRLPPSADSDFDRSRYHDAPPAVSLCSSSSSSICYSPCSSISSSSCSSSSSRQCPSHPVLSSSATASSFSITTSATRYGRSPVAAGVGTTGLSISDALSHRVRRLRSERVQPRDGG